MSKIVVRLGGSDFEQLGWKYYNTIVKKAMEQEFSWSGLSLSMAIAFFVVISCAQALSLTYQSLASRPGDGQKIRIYQLERADYRNGAEAADSYSNKA